MIVTHRRHPRHEMDGDRIPHGEMLRGADPSRSLPVVPQVDLVGRCCPRHRTYGTPSRLPIPRRIRHGCLSPPMTLCGQHWIGTGVGPGRRRPQFRRDRRALRRATLLFQPLRRMTSRPFDGDRSLENRQEFVTMGESHHHVTCNHHDEREGEEVVGRGCALAPRHREQPEPLQDVPAELGVIPRLVVDKEGSHSLGLVLRHINRQGDPSCHTLNPN